MIEQYYGRYMSSDFGARMMAEMDSETEMQTEMKTEISEGDFAKAENSGEIWRPRRDLNPLSPRKPKKEKS